MTPVELYNKYKGRQAIEPIEDASYDGRRSFGIVIGYTREVRFPLIIAITHRVDSLGNRFIIDDNTYDPIGWSLIDFWDIIVECPDWKNGYQYISENDILFKFGR